jgi:hypothetical protein
MSRSLSERGVREIRARFAREIRDSHRNSSMFMLTSLTLAA